MKNLAYYNGKFGPIDELTVPFNDRVHFFGDGVYDVTYVRDRVPFALDEHLDRLYNSARLLDIRIPVSKEEFAATIMEMSAKVDSPDQFLYLQASRGTQPRLHTYPEDMTANLWIMIKPQKVKDVFTEVKAITAEDTRFFHCNIKTLNLIPAVMYAQQAQRAGVFETILYRKPDRVTECAHANVHIINQNNEFQTAPTDNLILPGIARAHLIKACRALGIAVREEPFTLEEMMNAKEVIISSSSAFGLRCVEIDGQPVGGKAAEQLRAIQQWVLDEYNDTTRA
ncbi:MAG: aminotransferase class IV [Clostridia bacterium]|nr:aminotransferase class IV [Clostridia bacterium]